MRRIGPGVGLLVAACLLSSGVAFAVSPTSGVQVEPTPAVSAVPPPTPVPPVGSPSPYPADLGLPEPTIEPPDIGAASAILQDLDTGQTLFALRSDQPRPVASLTKVMTALIALERTRPSEPVRTSAFAAGQSGAELGLVPEERQPVRELLYGLMLGSANDAAIALAEHLAGDVGSFIAQMNRRAEGLGLRNTSFRSPNGLDDRGYSTARDLAAITRLAFRDETFREVVATRARRVPAPHGGPRHIQNRNALLWLYPGAIGVKTGFTTAAGYSLIAAAERDGERLLAVVLGGAEPVWRDAAILLDHGFHAYDRRELVREGERVGSVRVGGIDVPALAARSFAAYVHTETGPPARVIRPAGGLRLPVAPGRRVGLLLVRAGGRLLGRVGLVAGEVPGLAGPSGAPPPLWWRVVRTALAFVLFTALAPTADRPGEPRP